MTPAETKWQLLERLAMVRNLAIKQANKHPNEATDSIITLTKESIDLLKQL